MISVNSTVGYKYDGEGRRDKKLIGENTRFIYGIGGALIAEFNGSTGTLQKEYVSGGGMMAVVDPSAGTRYTTTDHLGSPRVVTNGSGAAVSRHDYMPFGIEIGSTIGGRTTAMGYGASDGVRNQFTGQQRDTETGLDFFQARYYSNSHGRFLSADPLQASADPRRPQTWNRYSYVLNNPLKLVDPSGMSEQHPSPEDSSTDLHGGAAGGAGGGALSAALGQDGDPITGMNKEVVDTAITESIETVTDPQDTKPTDLKDRVEKIAATCSAYLGGILDAFGPGVYSHNFGVIFDRVSTIEITDEPFRERKLPVPGISGLAVDDKGRKIYVSHDYHAAKNNQEFRWNAIANVVVFELLHHAKKSGTFSDDAIDRAVIKVMGPNDQKAAQKQMNEPNYFRSTIAHRELNKNCFNKAK